jgi:GT2 family glycosyltransferase
MTIDVIILSYAKNDEILQMNIDCINSILDSTKNYNFNFIVVETENDKSFNYPFKNVKVIQPNESFNYNKFLNFGLDYCKNNWILISNNDTIYHKNFLEEMLESYSLDDEILSMSPMDDSWHCHKTFDKSILIHYGYRVPFHITGWSILLNKLVIDKIGKFDETFDFWYQDNDYAANLIVNNIKHALITNSKITHLTSKSHDLIDDEKKYDLTEGSSYKFKNKWLKQ